MALASAGINAASRVTNGVNTWRNSACRARAAPPAPSLSRCAGGGGGDSQSTVVAGRRLSPSVVHVASRPPPTTSTSPMVIIAVVILAIDIVYWCVHAWATFVQAMRLQPTAASSYTSSLSAAGESLLPIAPQLVLFTVGAGGLMAARGGRHCAGAQLATAVLLAAFWLAADAYLAFMVAMWRMLSDDTNDHCAVFAGLVSRSSMGSSCGGLNMLIMIGHVLYFVWSFYKCFLYCALVTHVQNKAGNRRKAECCAEATLAASRAARRITRTTANGGGGGGGGKQNGYTQSALVTAAQRDDNNGANVVVPPPTYYECGSADGKAGVKVVDTV